MIKKSRKWVKAVSVMMLSSLVVMTGCSKNNKNEPADTEEVVQTTDQVTQDSSEDVATSEEQAEEAKEKADIEALAANNVYHVNWYTQDGTFEAGTSFLMESEAIGQNVLVSAFHYLWPDNADTFTGAELPDYVLGGEIYNTKTGESTGATLKNCLIIEDADAVPVINKDVSAFTIENGSGLNTLPLATEPVKEGDTVYLLANLYDTDDVHENCVYEGTVISEDDGVLYYELDEKYGTTGASGAPVVNEYGEVVGIHIGSNGSTRCAHSASSFLEQINAATISDVSYPSDLSTLESTSDNGTDSESTDSSSSDQEIHYLNREDTMSTIFFDLQITGISITDELNGYTSTDGYQFMVLTIAMDAKEDVASQVDMYYNDFWIEWGNGDDEYDYSQETGLTDAQLEDSFIVYAGETTTGDLVYMIPSDAESVDFGYMDYYNDGDTDEIIYDDFYIMTLPVEEWSR